MERADEESAFYFNYPIVENVHILHQKEFAMVNSPIYKVGETERARDKRFVKYPKGTKEIITMQVNGSKRVQELIIDRFRSLFVHRLDIGRDYFEGDIYAMKKEFQKTVNGDRKTPEGNINMTRDENKKDIVPLTIERIRDHIPNYTIELAKMKREGLKKWILHLIMCKGGPNLKCIDRDKPVFTRLNEKGSWIKDHLQFMKNIFLEKDKDGKTILSRIYDYIELLMEEVRDSKPYREHKDYKSTKAFLDIVRVDNVRRVKLLKGIMSDIAYERYPKDFLPIFESESVVLDDYSSNDNVDDNSDDSFDPDTDDSVDEILSVDEEGEEPKKDSKGKNFGCSFCKKDFSTKGSLDRHMNSCPKKIQLDKKRLERLKKEYASLKGQIKVYKRMFGDFPK